jgi:hypothetical protein
MDLGVVCLLPPAAILLSGGNALCCLLLPIRVFVFVLLGPV